MGIDIDDIARLAVAELNADGVDQDELRDPVRALGRQLGGDPAAERDTNDDQIFQPQILDQVEIAIGDIVDRRHVLRPRRAPDPGCEGANTLYAFASCAISGSADRRRGRVEEQQGLARALDQQLGLGTGELLRSQG